MRTTIVHHSRKAHTCETCHKTIPVGEGYKYITPRLSFHGKGITRTRCLSCPPWREWEYSQRRTQPIMQLQDTYAADLQDLTPDTAQDRLDEWATIIQEVADGAQESFDNMPEGLQQGETGQRLEELATELSTWADEVRAIDTGDTDDYEHEQCAVCDGEGQCDCSTCESSGVNLDAEGDTDEEKGPCPDCDGKGTVDCPECDGSGETEALTDDGISQWRDAFEQEVSAVLDACPVEV